MRTWEWGLVGVLGIAGIYFLIFHQDPLPFNHEAIGLGTVHALHDVIGLVLLGIAAVVVWRARRAEREAVPGVPPSGSA